jgi:hypothetical protein
MLLSPDTPMRVLDLSNKNIIKQPDTDEGTLLRYLLLIWPVNDAIIEARDIILDEIKRNIFPS